ncbi:MAG: PP2C family protein-serine/threonine phosphatase [Bacteroidetes bacterium]|nr:PP2C family protein-serine/threonine phosphatase [Bacteroidota bacterium]
MEHPHIPRSLVSIILGLIAAAALLTAIFLLYPDTHSYGGLTLKEDDVSIVRHTRQLLAAMQLDSVSYIPSAALHSRQPILERMYSHYGATEANRLLRSRVPGYYWDVRLMREEPEESGAVTLSAGGEEKMVQRILGGDLRFQFNTSGKLISVDLPMEDSVAAISLSPSAAYALVRGICVTHAEPALLSPLVRLAAYPDSMTSDAALEGIQYQSSVRPQRTDHLFSWSVYDDALRDTVDVRVVVKGRVLTQLSAVYRFTRGFTAAQTVGIADVFEIIFYVIFSIILLVVGFRRLRAFEIGFRSAFYLALLITTLFAVWLYFELSAQMGQTLELLIPLLIAPLFVGGAFVPLWAIAESIGRETWKEKFITFDLLRTGHFLHSRIGRALLQGAVAGLAMLVVGLVAAKLSGGFDTVWIRESNGDGMRQFSTPSPGLFIIGNALLSNMYGIAFLLVAIVSLAHQSIRSKVILIAAAAAVFTIIDNINLVPLPTAWLVILPVMLLLVWLYVRTDVLTAFIAAVVFSIADSGVLLLLPGNTAYHTDGMLLATGLALLLAWAIAAMLVPDSVEDLEDIAPRFQRHITERQRLSRELEIARDVQMSFLPKHNPHMEGLDIASHCAPALEVGGDYYDFIDLGEGRLGIAIGDVSGKGTQAAFYMTLTKGFLQALAAQHDSPAAVLVEMNRLFYRNVERGHFISMIYAVFDVPAGMLHIARAGHSPVMRRSADSTVDLIQSRGIALGFEAGETFSATIEDVTVPLHSGDVFVLYTDGYPEAMTRAREEYGEDRLATALQHFTGSSAEELLSHLYRDTRRFTGRAEQHDDMTMVVVRIP